MKITAILLSIFIVLNFMPEKSKLRYVPLGDSYTIGTGATPGTSWPSLLAKHLREKSIDIELVKNLGHNSWTTQDVIDKELPEFEKLRPTFATLLIGTNDWIQGVTPEKYRKNLVYIIEKVRTILPDRSKLLLIKIPDFSVAPGGKYFTKGKNVSAGLTEFNRIIEEEAKKRRLKTADLFTESKKMGKDISLVAPDGLHPSAKGYEGWEKQIFPVAFEMLK